MLREMLMLGVMLFGCTSKVNELPVESGSSGEDETGTSSTTGVDVPTPTPQPTPFPVSGTTTGDGGSSGGPEDSSSSGGNALHAVSGTITRSVEPAQGEDGVGNLYLAVVDTCGMVFDIVEVGAVVDADPGAGAAYEIADIPPGTWHLIAFLDDNDNANQAAPAPDRGDLVASDGGSVGCAEFTIDQGDVTDVDLDLNFVMVF